MKNFIKVTANQCTSSGDLINKIAQKTFYLNIDLIGAIDNNSLLLKGGNILILNGVYFKDFHLTGKLDLNSL